MIFLLFFSFSLPVFYLTGVESHDTLTYVRHFYLEYDLSPEYVGRYFVSVVFVSIQFSTYSRFLDNWAGGNATHFGLMTFVRT